MPCKVSASSGDLEEDVGYKMRIVSINQLGKFLEIGKVYFEIISFNQLGKFLEIG